MRAAESAYAAVLLYVSQSRAHLPQAGWGGSNGLGAQRKGGNPTLCRNDPDRKWDQPFMKDFLEAPRSWTKIDKQVDNMFTCFQHWHSFSPCKQKLAVVISTFHRISRSCNSWTNVLEAVSTMKHELLSLKYPLRVLLRAAGRMATTDARWASIEGAWRADSRR